MSAIDQLGMTKILTPVVDSKATGFGTFQSHNQKVVSNSKGVFMTYLKARSPSFDEQDWQLSWSKDGGNTFQTLYEETSGTFPPTLETGEHDNLYLLRADSRDGDARLYRFSALNHYANPVITKIRGASSDKFSMIYDRSRKQLYYFSCKRWGPDNKEHGFDDPLSYQFHVIGLDGTILLRQSLTKAGASAASEYSLLSLDGNHVLHTAWTTQHNIAYAQAAYWDIHYMQSPDGGKTWRKFNGQPLTLPVVADENGPTDRISLPDESKVWPDGITKDGHPKYASYRPWLSNMLAKDGKVHFLYLAQLPSARQHYVRYDLKTGQREKDTQQSDLNIPADFKGQRIHIASPDGFFATRSSLPNSPLYCISKELGSNRIVCLASDDNGTTWYDYAVSDPFDTPSTLYAIGGCRELTSDGHIIGSFTDLYGSSQADAPGSSHVHFLKCQAGLAGATVLRKTVQNETMTLEFGYIHGQPEQIQFDTGYLGSWLVFNKVMMLPPHYLPKQFRLRSRLNVISQFYLIP